MQDVIPLINGIFGHMNYTFKGDVTKTTLDYRFGTEFGNKNPSPGVTRILGDDDGPLTDEKLNFLAQVILETYKARWDRLGAVYDIEYDPIHNFLDEWEDTSSEVRDFDGSTQDTETLEYGKVETLDKTRTDNLANSETTTYNKTDTRTDNLTELETRNLASSDSRTDNLMQTDTYGHTSTRTDNLSEVVDEDRTNSGTESGSKGVYGFNSSSSVPSDTSSSSNSGTETIDRTTTNTGTQATAEGGSDTKANTGTQSSTGTDTGTVTTANTGTMATAQTGTVGVAGSNTGTQDTDQTITNSGVDTTRKTGSTQEDETTDRDRSGRHFGNIGNLTSQKQIKEEIELWSWNYVNTILNDVKDFCCLPVYLTPFKEDI